MIRIFVGKVGSGKTISAVMELLENELNPYGLNTYSNIVTKKRGKFAIKKNTTINRDMFIKRELIKVTKSGEEIFKQTFNKEFWESKKGKGFNIVLDEAHTLLDARAFSTTQNRIMNSFIALVRKIATTPTKDSTLTLITQQISAIDVRVRNSATEIRSHICVYDKVCSKCGAYWSEHSNLSDYRKLKNCPRCNSYAIKKVNHKVLVHFFDDVKDYLQYEATLDENLISRSVWFYNLNKYFNYYETAQLDDLISNYD